jgi:hypothetical protein
MLLLRYKKNHYYYYKDKNKIHHKCNIISFDQEKNSGLQSFGVPKNIIRNCHSYIRKWVWKLSISISAIKFSWIVKTVLNYDLIVQINNLWKKICFLLKVSATCSLFVFVLISVIVIIKSGCYNKIIGEGMLTY